MAKRLPEPPIILKVVYETPTPLQMEMWNAMWRELHKNAARKWEGSHAGNKQ